MINGNKITSLIMLLGGGTFCWLTYSGKMPDLPGYGLAFITFSAGIIWFLSRKPLNKKVLYLSIALMIVCTIASVIKLPQLASSRIIVKIEANGEKNPSSHASEVWFYVTKDGKRVGLTDYENEKWRLNDAKTHMYSKKYTQPAAIVLTFPNDGSYELHLRRHSWSGIAHITENHHTETIDLFADPAIKYYAYPLKASVNLTELLINLACLAVGYLSLLYGLLSFILFISERTKTSRPGIRDKYRPDIDGLRSLAVLAVVVFHFNESWLPGGFIGVDIFFVISGFLITGIILNGVENNSFSFRDFYARRVRRILPAAFFATFLTLIFGCIFLLPEDVISLAKSAVATVASAANIYFWLFQDTSYFATDAGLTPLLHMWSLGVEEQFYLLWPALLFAAFKIAGKKGVIVFSAIIMVFSFIFGQLYFSHDPQFAYYMLPSRAGELMMGGLTALLWSNRKQPLPRFINEILATLGLAMILWSIIFIDGENVFPGLIAVIPTLGVAFIITAGMGSSVINALFSFKPAVAVGKVSFSLYLWHWPVLAFYRYSYTNLSLAGGIVCAVIIALLTVFTYFAIERPFRKVSPGPVRMKLKYSAIACSFLAVVALGIVSIKEKGIIQLISPKDYRTKVAGIQEQYKVTGEYVCYNNMENKECTVGNPSKPADTLIFGDSYAGQSVGYLKIIAEHYDVNMQNVILMGCPVLPVDKIADFMKTKPLTVIESCIRFQQYVRQQIAEKNYKNIIIGYSWKDMSNQAYAAAVDEVIKEFADTGRNIVFILDIPIIEAFDKKCEQKSLKIPMMNCDFSSSKFKHELHRQKINKYLAEAAKKYKNVYTIDFHNLICPQGRCSSSLEGQFLYSDSYHLGWLGSEKLGSYAVQHNTIAEPLKKIFRQTE